MKKQTVRIVMLMIILLTGVFSSAATAKDKVRFAHVPWSCVTIKTEVAIHIIDALGYDATTNLLSVPIAYNALANNEADVFLGNWMPTMESIARPHFESGRVESFSPVMENAKYTLAVPSYVYEGGLQHFEDIAKYGDRLGYKIHGIEEGNDGNEVVEYMIENDLFGLGDFELVPSSEAAMLSQVRSYARNEEWIVFLGWSPHWMNYVIDMEYLAGSDERTFGENDGTADVFINIRAGFDKEQPNVARFLENYKVPIDMINVAMTMLHEQSGVSDLEAGLAWMKDNPDVYRGWLEGVETVDGRPALDVYEAALKDM